MNLGSAIKFCRQQRRMTQAELAKRVGVATSFVSLVENDHRGIRFDQVVSFADALEIPLVILIFLAMPFKDVAEFDKAVAERLSLMTIDMFRVG